MRLDVILESHMPALLETWLLGKRSKLTLVPEYKIVVQLFLSLNWSACWRIYCTYDEQRSFSESQIQLSRPEQGTKCVLTIPSGRYQSSMSLMSRWIPECKRVVSMSPIDTHPYVHVCILPFVWLLSSFLSPPPCQAPVCVSSMESDIDWHTQPRMHMYSRITHT